MASNPYVNKVQFGNQTVMDISDTTAEESDVIKGKTFYKANGARSTGTGTLGGIYETAYRLVAGNPNNVTFSQFKQITSVFVRSGGYIAFGMLDGDNLSTFNHFTNYNTQIDVLGISGNIVSFKMATAANVTLGVTGVLA